MFELAFLASDRGPLTKRFELGPDGELLVTPYPHVTEFTSTTHPVNNLNEFFAHLSNHALLGHCLLKGTLNRALRSESRAGSTDRTDLTHWLVLDVDGLKGVTTPEQFVQLLPKPFHTVSYIAQLSASAGLDPRPGLRAHIFFMLEKPILPAMLKLWLRHLNLSTPTFRDALQLSRLKAVLKWPIDPSVAQNDKLIYCAEPYIGPGIKCENIGPRSKLVTKRKTCVTLNLDTLPTEDAIATDSLAALNTLLGWEGLPPRARNTLKTIKGVEVLSQPGTAHVTGVKTDRGFTYLNLNGGDSWGYFYPTDNPAVLYNFKGEPNLLLRELAPQFFSDAVNAATDTKDAALRALNENFTGATWDDEHKLWHIAILSRHDDTYYRGTWDPENKDLKLSPTGSLTKVIHYLKQHGQPVGDFVPTWDMHFDFDSDTIVDIDNKRINLYQPSEYMATPKRTRVLPKLCGKLLRHVLAYDDIVVEHFINWLAYIVQYRRKTGTAWVLHGVQGTGKGVLYSQVITPLIGSAYCNRTSLNSFEQQFNGFAERSLMLLVDESQVSDLQRHSTAVANIKQLITEETISIRRMRTDAFLVRSFMNLIFASNTHDAAYIDASDRRFNVAPRQETPLISVMTRTEIEKLGTELPSLAGYLLSRNVDVQAVATPLNTDERTRLQRISQDPNERIANVIREGDLQWLWDERPDHPQTVSFIASSGVHNPPTYDDILDYCFNSGGVPTNFSRDMLEALYYYLSGLSFPTRNRFSNFAEKRGFNVTQVKINNTKVRGIQNVRWKISEELRAQWLELKRGPRTKSKVSHLKEVSR